MKNILIALILISSSLFSFSSQAIEVSFEEDHSLPLVNLMVALKGGSVSDPRDASGLTSFTAKMMLRGTELRTKEAIDIALDQIGAQLEVYVDHEKVVFRGAVLASQVDEFLSILGEILTEPGFSEREIKKLKTEVVSEILDQQGNDDWIAKKQMNRFFFGSHPYANSSEGKISDLEELERKEIISHYEKTFRSQQLLVLGTGDVSTSKIENWANRIKFKTDSHPYTFPETKLPQFQAERRLLLIDKPDRTQSQIYIAHPGILLTDVDYVPYYIGNYAFGGPSFHVRLMKEIRVKRGWSYGAGSSMKAGIQPKAWSAHLFPAMKDTVPATELTLKLIEDLAKSGISAEEFEFAKNSLINHSGFNYNTPVKRIENRLAEKIFGLNDGFFKSLGERYKLVTLDQVNASLKKFFDSKKLQVAVLTTTAPMKKKLQQVVHVDDAHTKVIRYTDE